MPEQVEAPEGGCGPWEAHAGAGSWQDLWPRGERSPGWSSLVLKVCTPWERPTLEQFVKNCSLWEGLMLEKFMEDCLP